MHDNTIYVDLDGTLCPVKKDGEYYADLPANQALIERLRQSQRDGYKIVVYTARNMRTYDGDISRINAVTAPIVLDWLTRHDVPFDGLIMGKPWPGPKGFYVDDKAIRPDEYVRMSDTEIHALTGLKAAND